MLRRSRVLQSVVALFLLASSACITAPRGVAKAQETLNDFNLHSRFGRIEVAAEDVTPGARAEFIQHRAGWGSKVRIADSEVIGIQVVNKDKTEVRANVRIAWYRANEGELHVTVLRQAWKDFKGDWKLIREERGDGDIGLIGESMERVAAEGEPSRRAQFPTVKLTGQTSQED